MICSCHCRSSQYLCSFSCALDGYIEAVYVMPSNETLKPPTPHPEQESYLPNYMGNTYETTIALLHKP